MGGSAKDEPLPQRPRRPLRPIAEIKRDLDAVVEEFSALTDQLKREAAEAARKPRRTRSA